MSATKKPSGVSRRDFLAKSAAGAGAAVLPETAVPEGLEGVKVVSIVRS